MEQNKNLDLSSVAIDKTKELWHEALGMSDEEVSELAELFNTELNLLIKHAEEAPADQNSISNQESVLNLLPKLSPKQAMCLIGMGITDALQEALTMYLKRQSIRKKLEVLKNSQGSKDIAGLFELLQELKGLK